MKWKCRKWICVVGAATILLPNGFYVSWGNLSVYALSYLILVHDGSINDQSAWVLGMFVAFWTVLAICSNFLIKKLGKMVCLALGIAMNDLAVFLSFFSIQKSLFTFTLTQGVLSGAGTGLLDVTTLQFVIEWADGDAGRLTSGVQAALSLGGFFTNLLITAYINPDNLSTDVYLGRNEFFSQPSVLDKVPGVFLVLGCFSLGCHLVGILMMRPKRPEDENMNTVVELTCKDKDYSNDLRRPQLNEHFKYETQNERTAILEKNCDKPRDFTAKEMMKTGSFYAIWITFFFGGISMVVIDNYYKAFGQLYIHDDHFLTNLGAVLALSTAIIGFFWGFLMDKAGVKFALILGSVLLSFGQIWFWLSVLPSKWVYSFMAVLMAGLGGSVVSTYTAATALLFGSKYFSGNFGIIMTSMLAFYTLVPVAVKPLLTHFGWWATFTTGAGFNIIRIIITMIWIPQM